MSKLRFMNHFMYPHLTGHTLGMGFKIVLKIIDGSDLNILINTG